MVRQFSGIPGTDQTKTMELGMQHLRYELVSMRRRHFLFGGAALLATHGIGSKLPAGSLPLSSAPPVEEILALAARAPSGHNTQPWNVKIIAPTHWTIGIAPSRRLPAVDPTARETYLSLGAFLENLIIASAHYGYQTEYDVLASSPSSMDVIDLRFLADKPRPQRLDRIRLRRTVRNGYRAEEIRAADRKDLMTYGEGLHYFPKGSGAATHISEGTLEANRQQAFRNPAEEELAQWIRWSAADGAKYKNGLTPASMEIDGISGWYVSHFFNHESVLSKSFRDTTVKQVQQRVTQGAGWLIVTSKSAETAALIDTGRKVERMWLGLREKNIAIHPMTQMLEEAPGNSSVAKSLGVEGVPQFILRVGYPASYPLPTSLRMPPTWIVQGGVI